jgi:hypothetical protein
LSDFATYSNAERASCEISKFLGYKKLVDDVLNPDRATGKPGNEASTVDEDLMLGPR